MPKLLRPDEKITFVQTRAPTEMWRDVKASAIKVASDGTATRLCTNGMLEYLKLRRWMKGEPWLRPQDLARKAGATGFQQVNLPLSNMDEEGHIIASKTFLERQGVLELFNADKHALRDALHTGAFSKLIYVAAEQLEISGATFAYTFLHWLHNTKCKPALAAIAAHEQDMAAATAFVRENKPRRSKKAA
jgi:hypothetical protein